MCRSISGAPRSRVLAEARRWRRCSSSSTGGGDVAQAPGVLAQRQQRAPDPDDGPGLHRRQRRAVDVPAVARPVAVARVGPVPHQRPIGRVGLNPFAELRVLLTAARHHGDEAAAGAVDVVHVLEGTKFRVRARTGSRCGRPPRAACSRSRYGYASRWRCRRCSGTPRARCRRRSWSG